MSDCANKVSQSVSQSKSMLLLSTYFDHTNLLTTLHHWCDDSLIHCISAPESAAINVVQFVENTQYTTSKQDSGQLGGPRRNIAIRFVTEKPPKQCGYMTTKKVWEYVYSFRHNTWIWQCRVLSLSDRRYCLNPLSQTRIDWVGRYRIRWTFKLSCVWH